MGRVKIIALKRRREPDFDTERLLAVLLLLISLIFIASRVSAQAPPNDLACNATVINVGLNSPFTNVTATPQFGEQAIPTGTCTAQGNWCSGETAPQLNHTVWFKFTVPAAGTGSYAFRVNGNAGTFDSQVALFSAASCADLTNGNAVRLGANDDSTGSLFNSYMVVNCLTPTQTYYILVDGYGTTTNANFYVHVIELSDRNAVANAGSDQTICYSLFPQFPVNGTVLGIAGSTTWTTTGDGTFANPSALSTTYSPGLNDKASGITSLILSTNDPVGVCGISRDTLVLTVIPDSIYAGANKTICANEEFITMTGQAFLFTSFQWTSTGDGSFDDPAALNAKYTPGINDRLQPFVDVVLRGVSTQCFNTVYDTVRIFNSNATGAIVNLGADTIICVGSSIALSAQQLSSFSSVQWSTSGNGTFSNPNGTTTNYTPGTNDINNGLVTITLSAQGITPCNGSKSDSKQIFLQSPPAVLSINGGGSYCATSVISLTADAENYDALNWTTSGDGVFSDPNDLATNYTPGPNDLALGFASLTLHAASIAPCLTEATSGVTIFITAAPQVSLSVPSTSCGFATISLSSSVSNYQTINWSSTGDGSFDNPSSTKPKYTPGPLDVASGSVSFNVTVLGNSPCNAFFASGSTSITPDPSVVPSAPSAVCTGNTIPVNATVTAVSTLLWDTDGDGFFVDPTVASTIYIPGPTDYSNGSVNLFISVNGVSPCVSSDNETVHINFTNHAIADAGPDEDVVAGQTVTLDGFVESSVVYTWTTAGDGTFNNSSILNAIYTPGPGDILAGNVVLTLTAADNSPCSLLSSDQVEINIFPDALLAIKLYLEGMYTFPGNYPSLFASGYSVNSTESDSILISFYQNSAPYNLIESYTAIVATNGIAVVSLPAAYAGNNYYISIRHRNSLETWTNAPVIINSFGLIDFTSSTVLRHAGGSSGTKYGTSLH